MAEFKTATTYILSGTGNTYRLGCWIKDRFEEKNIPTDLKMVEDANFKEDLQDSATHQNKNLIMGILFPTHGFMPPWSMIKFLFKLPRSKKMPAFAAATRGALKFKYLYIPGAAGFATFFAALVLLFKGYDVKGFFSIDMPSNFINFHSALHPQKVKTISENSHKRMAKFIDPILNGRHVIFTLNNLYELFWSVLLFWLVPIFPILYLIYGKTFMAKIMFSNKNCVSCGRCARFCPNHGIEMKSFYKEKPRPYWTYHCENCLRCMGYCKKRAIEAGHSWAIILYFITSIPVLKISFQKLNNPFDLYSLFDSYWYHALVDTIFFIPALFLSYFIFWCLNRIPIINYFFSLTTLTHYYKRFHEPDTRLKDLLKSNNLKPKKQ